MTTRHAFHARFNVHAADADKPCVIIGDASVFNVMIDSFMPTIIEPGAFRRTLAERGDRVKLLWSHDETRPLGKVLELVETPKSLRMRAKLSNTSLGRDAAELLRDGAVDSLSIGFNPVKSWIDNSGPEPVRHLTDVELFEVSIVSFPANSAARITQIHARGTSLNQSIAAFNRRVHDYREAQLRSLQVEALRAGVIVRGRRT